MKSFFEYPIVWFLISLLLLGACTFLPLRIQNNDLRNFVMRWVLIPVSLVIILYSYPVGIEICRRLALKF